MAERYENGAGRRRPSGCDERTKNAANRQSSPKRLFRPLTEEELRARRRRIAERKRRKKERKRINAILRNNCRYSIFRGDMHGSVLLSKKKNAYNSVQEQKGSG